MSRPAGRHTIGDDQRQGMLALPFFLPQKEKEKHRTHRVRCFWWRQLGSNQRPLACEANALTS